MLDITTLAAWGESICGIAVVVSLIEEVQRSSVMRVTSGAASASELFRPRVSQLQSNYRPSGRSAD